MILAANASRNGRGGLAKNIYHTEKTFWGSHLRHRTCDAHGCDRPEMREMRKAL